MLKLLNQSVNTPYAAINMLINYDLTVVFGVNEANTTLTIQHLIDLIALIRSLAHLALKF